MLTIGIIYGSIQNLDLEEFIEICKMLRKFYILLFLLILTTCGNPNHIRDTLRFEYAISGERGYILNEVIFILETNGYLMDYSQTGKNYEFIKTEFNVFDLTEGLIARDRIIIDIFDRGQSSIFYDRGVYKIVLRIQYQISGDGRKWINSTPDEISLKRYEMIDYQIKRKFFFNMLY